MEQVEVAGGELLTSLGSGRITALDDLYERYSALAYSLAYRTLGDRGGAEEVVQDSFLSLWRSAGTYDMQQSSERSWLLRIVRHRCIDHIRKQSRTPPSVGEAHLAALPARNDVVADVFAGITSDEVRMAMGNLSTEQRETVELAYFGGYSQTEIAERLDLPLGTVKGRMRLALRHLRDSLLRSSPGSPDYALS